MSHARILAMLEESGFDHDEMAEVVDALAPLDELADQAPAPSAELAALFGPARHGAVARASAPRSRARGAAVGAVVLALSSVGATGLSAAANTLPRPFQHQVARVLARLPAVRPAGTAPARAALRSRAARCPARCRRLRPDRAAAGSAHEGLRSRRLPAQLPLGESQRRPHCGHGVIPAVVHALTQPHVLELALELAES